MTYNTLLKKGNFNCRRKEIIVDIGHSTIHQYVHKGKIPFNKVPGGRKLIFKRQEIDKWIENGKTDNTQFYPTTISEEIWQGVLDKNE